MIWEDQDEDLRNFFKQLIALRKQFSEIFSYGTMTWHYDDDKKTFSLTRSYKETTLTATFNQGEYYEVEKRDDGYLVKITMKTTATNCNQTDLSLKNVDYESL